MVQCPGCDLALAEDDIYGQMSHMVEEHPDIVSQRRAEAARWDGWEDG
jgi:hypothetical protein